jgi:hypothetical protein
MHRTTSCHDFALAQEVLTADAIQAAVRFPIHVACRSAAFPERADGRRVPSITRGVNEIIVADVEHVGEPSKLRTVARDEFARRRMGECGGAHVLQAVVVGAS